jgi:hypothetical protein
VRGLGKYTWKETCPTCRVRMHERTPIAAEAVAGSGAVWSACVDESTGREPGIGRMA